MKGQDKNFYENNHYSTPITYNSINVNDYQINILKKWI